MSTYVLKFGGVSVANVDIMHQAIAHIRHLKNDRHKVVVVVSAMAGDTDRLTRLVRETDHHNNSIQDASSQNVSSEQDVILSTGEQITSGLMALLLQKQGLDAQSLQGWQVPIVTTNHPGRARIVGVGSQRITELLQKNIIPVISGFQGITSEQQIRTLGRGGSDLSAIAIAGQLQAESCILYKDVDGIAAADPKIVSNPIHHTVLTYAEVLEMTSLGAKVIQSRAIELAMINSVAVTIKPTFSQGAGTLITEDRTVCETESVAGIVLNNDETKICLLNFPVTVRAKLLLIQKFAQEKIKLDMITHHGALDEKSHGTLTFTVSQIDTQKTIELCELLKSTIGYRDYIVHKKVAKISLIGIGLKNNLGIVERIFETLTDLNISLYGFTYSELTVSILISSIYANQVVKQLTYVFNLQQKKSD